MRSPTKTDFQFDTTDYSLFVATYVAIINPICQEYSVTPTQLRIMAAVDTLTRMFSWRLLGKGITPTQISRTTGFTGHHLPYNIHKLRDRGLLTEEVIVEGKRKVYRYRLSKTGKTIINKITLPEKAHERIVDHLYEKKILK
jgi:DNA-binding MarR family transcriptional regulator